MLTLDPSKCAQRVKKSKAHNRFWLQLSFDARGSPHVHICKTTFCHKIFFFSQIMSTFNGSKCQPCSIVQNTIIWELFLSRSFMLTWTRTQDSESRAQLCYKERKNNNTAQHEQRLFAECCGWSEGLPRYIRIVSRPAPGSRPAPIRILPVEIFDAPNWLRGLGTAP